MTGNRSIRDTEKAVRAKLGGTPVEYEQMAAVSNIYRAAAAVRQHFENSVLRGAELTWTSFVVLYVVWIWGEMETRYVAEEAGISKGTLTGVARTLMGRGLIERRGHPDDGRLVLLRLTDEGERLMGEVFPAFNAEEAFVTEGLTDAECETLADLLRKIVVRTEDNGEERRLELLAGEAPARRRSGRRAKPAP
ncbi:MarR family winged helix-turn-helix transcriptional regulator [Streptomyces sp. KL118A]|uniref:MarR family winged helix-turn-helix transcriptional regulator n=1 Tax=Streptomyces sp. KL118A TaxID=3045153 RepID=UPI00278C3119|nr:MarR family winged helix-turn-helix transcriptional regulator [Streptomyces sp. KL118A]